MNRKRGILVLAMFLAVWLIPGTAMADPPTNDEFAGSVALDADVLPIHVEQDTSMATTSDADQLAADLCEGPPATDAAVWYSLTSSTDAALSISGEGTDYAVGFLIYTGGPGTFELVDCFPFSGQLEAAAGVTYHLLVIDDQGDEGGNGGNLVMHIDGLGEELCPGLFANDPVATTGNVIIGTPGDDVIEGTNGRDIILGLEGNDTIKGLKGDDVIFGCDGDDHIDGGPGNDELFGDALWLLRRSQFRRRRRRLPDRSRRRRPRLAAVRRRHPAGWHWPRLRRGSPR